MCIIIYKPSGQSIDKSLLNHCFLNNPHGAGYMLPFNGIVKIRKGFWDFDDFMLSWNSLKNIAQLPIVIHFRLATTGAINFSNCHPHRIVRDLAFAHNGTLHCHDPRNEQASDTIIFNNRYLKGLKGISLQDDGIFEHLTEVVGKANKLVFMNGKGKVVICNEDQGVWDGGLWFSNPQYQQTWEYPIMSLDYNMLSKHQ